MTTFKDILLSEVTTSSAVPNAPAGQLPQPIITAWNRTLDYDRKMKRKFSYFEVAYKKGSMTSGFKGHMTRAQNGLIKAIEDHDMDVNSTIKKLYQLYPPKHF
jgi:hypothetical protein